MTGSYIEEVEKMIDANAASWRSVALSNRAMAQSWSERFFAAEAERDALRAALESLQQAFAMGEAGYGTAAPDYIAKVISKALSPKVGAGNE